MSSWWWPCYLRLRVCSSSPRSPPHTSWAASPPAWKRTWQSDCPGHHCWRITWLCRWAWWAPAASPQWQPSRCWEGSRLTWPPPPGHWSSPSHYCWHCRHHCHDFAHCPCPMSQMFPDCSPVFLEWNSVLSPSLNGVMNVYMLVPCSCSAAPAPYSPCCTQCPLSWRSH